MESIGWLIFCAYAGLLVGYASKKFLNVLHVNTSQLCDKIKSVQWKFGYLMIIILLILGTLIYINKIFLLR